MWQTDRSDWPLWSRPLHPGSCCGVPESESDSAGLRGSPSVRRLKSITRLCTQTHGAKDTVRTLFTTCSQHKERNSGLKVSDHNYHLINLQFYQQKDDFTFLNSLFPRTFSSFCNIVTLLFAVLISDDYPSLILSYCRNSRDSVQTFIHVFSSFIFMAHVQLP